MVTDRYRIAFAPACSLQPATDCRNMSHVGNGTNHLNSVLGGLVLHVDRYMACARRKVDDC